MTNQAITISYDSCDIDDYAISAAGISDDDLQSVSIVWSAEAKGQAKAPLQDRTTIEAVSSIVTDLAGGRYHATLVVSRHDFDALKAALAASPRRLTIEDGDGTFFCKKVAPLALALRSAPRPPPPAPPWFRQIEETSIEILSAIKSLEKQHKLMLWNLDPVKIPPHKPRDKDHGGNGFDHD
jgi:hypothetical protein